MSENDYAKVARFTDVQVTQIAANLALHMLTNFISAATDIDFLAVRAAFPSRRQTHTVGNLTP
jgi:hypothetical protein